MSQTVKLRKPFTFEDKEYKEITLNFDNLTGEHILEAERDFNRENSSGGNSVKELEKSFQVHIAARAGGWPVEAIKKLGAKDFVEVTLLTQHFLLR